ncbi:5066_t:CDS:1, partial [Gigaspora margarita]
MTIKLIGFPYSGPTMKVIITLRELGLPYEFETPANFEVLKTEDFLANKNP